MEKRRFGKTGLSLALVGIGGIPFMGMEQKAVEKVILEGIDCGVNFIETARKYGDSEEKIGRVLKGRREEVVLITKGHPVRDTEILDESLKALSVDCIDVYQLHGITPGRLKKMEDAGLLDALVREGEKGKFRFLGVTSHSPEAIFEAMSYDIFTSIQAPINFVEYERYSACMDYAVKKDLGIAAMKPLGGGVFPAKESLRFLQFTPVSAIPVGVQTPAEIREDVLAVSDPSPLSDDERLALEKELAFWGDKFCRKCGYCRGCPQGISVSSLMLTEIIYYRNGPREMLDMNYPDLLTSAEKCTSCGECVKKCPYSLKIPETLKGFREKFLPLLLEIRDGEAG